MSSALLLLYLQRSIIYAKPVIILGVMHLDSKSLRASMTETARLSSYDSLSFSVAVGVFKKGGKIEGRA